MERVFKQPSEKIPMGIDFDEWIEENDAVASQIVTANDENNADVTNDIIDSSSITGNMVVVVAKGGTLNKNYKITFKATTSNGYIYEDEILMMVRER